MRDGWERKVRSSSFFYQNMASRASKKMNKSPRSSRCWPSGHAAGKRPLLHGIFSKPPGMYKPPALPSGAAQDAHYPAGTRGDHDIQAVTIGPWLPVICRLGVSPAILFIISTTWLTPTTTIWYTKTFQATWYWQNNLNSCEIIFFVIMEAIQVGCSSYWALLPL